MRKDDKTGELVQPLYDRYITKEEVPISVQGINVLSTVAPAQANCKIVLPKNKLLFFFCLYSVYRIIRRFS